MTATARQQDVREVAAVLVALAGLRRREAFVSVGAGPLVDGALAAAAGPRTGGPVRVAVAGGPGDVPRAAASLAPGGRLVAVATDDDSAARAAAAAGAVLVTVVELADGVAWVGRRNR